MLKYSLYLLVVVTFEVSFTSLNSDRAIIICPLDIPNFLNKRVLGIGIFITTILMDALECVFMHRVNNKV